MLTGSANLMALHMVAGSFVAARLAGSISCSNWGGALELASIGLTIPLADLYAGTDVAP